MPTQKKAQSEDKKKKPTGKDGRTAKDRTVLARRVQNRFKTLLLQKALAEGEMISMRSVGRATGIPVVTLSAWMNNDVTRYDADKIAVLCDYFGCTVGDLIEYVPPGSGEK